MTCLAGAKERKGPRKNNVVEVRHRLITALQFEDSPGRRRWLVHVFSPFTFRR